MIEYFWVIGMGKILIKPKSLEQLKMIINKDIDGIILSVDKLSVNASFYIDILFLDQFDFGKKNVFISLNKLMHNSDLEHLRDVMHKLKNKDVKILFYDLAVYRIAKEYDMVDKLVVYQDHLNASNLSNKFYEHIGVSGSYVTSDITLDELLEIKDNSNLDIYFTVYGYLPIFYSRRLLVTNYLKYINSNFGENYKILSDMGKEYIIQEEGEGTTIYTEMPVNLINYLDKLDKIDYLVMDSNNIQNDEFNNMIDKFIKKDRIDDVYTGFIDKKTIYKVKNGAGDKNE